MEQLLWDTEMSLRSGNAKIVCGCDEAGRGPLAGPVFAAAVILPDGCTIEGLNDSKKLNEKKRGELFDIIRETCVDCAIAHAEVYEIEQINILNASMLAMRRAIAMLRVKPELALIDGNVARDFPIPAIPVIKGDGKCPSIAAASILAKVARDRFCAELDSFYPEYGFSVHKGYATKAHIAAIKKYGPCPSHRKSFLRKILKDAEQQNIW
ncbi:MAG: ribonuclease HII [Clostridia bacterium]|nr:ribonuclease HII [Clostridia bacterium]